MSYVNAFIAVAPDTRATTGLVPPARGSGPTIAHIHYEFISSNPYRHRHDEVLFLTHLRRLGIDPATTEEDRTALWNAFFSRPQACLRTSPLPRTYGWGLHFDAAGKVALVACDSVEYSRLSQDPGIEQFRAMRRARA